MPLIDQITVGDQLIITADQSPITSGIQAPLGSIVTVNDGSGLFIKMGSLATNYMKTITSNNLADITAVGTITSGVWQGSQIADAFLAAISWSKVTSTPTTLAGYGITNALSTTLTSAQIFIGNGSNIATAQAVTGDLTLSNTGVTTLATVNSNIFGTNSFIKHTVNAKGLITSATAVVAGDITTALGYTPVNRAGDTMSGFLTLNADPTLGLHAATKNYVDSFIAGSITWKQEVKVATTANITLSGTQTVDGFILSIGDRVLVKNQTTQSQNGIYIVAAGAWTRSTDTDTGAKIASATVMVQYGTINKDTQWTCSNSTDPIIGTDPITFVQISGPGTYIAGTGLTLTGNTFAIDATVATLAGTQTFTNKTISGATNTLTNIANASLTNSTITINGTPISLGGTVSTGTVTSIAISGAEFSITGSPITTSGTIALALAVQGGLTAGTYNNLTVNNKGIVTAASNISYLTANQTITLSGDVTGSGATAITATIVNNAITTAKIANAAVDLTTKVTGILPPANGGTGTSTVFTAGSIVFSGVGGVYAQKNTNLFWDNTNNSLGVGTATPTDTLHIVGTTRLEHVTGVSQTITGATINTTTATTTPLQLISIPTDTVVVIRTTVQARKTNTPNQGNSNGYVRTVRARNIAGTVVIGTISSDYTFEDRAAYNATFDVNGTNVRIMVKGAAGEDVTWTCTTVVTR